MSIFRLWKQNENRFLPRTYIVQHRKYFKNDSIEYGSHRWISLVFRKISKFNPTKNNDEIEWFQQLPKMSDDFGRGRARGRGRGTPAEQRPLGGGPPEPQVFIGRK